MAARPRSAQSFEHQPHDLARGLRVEAGGRLVDQQQVRLLHQGAGDADALALAAGERVGALVDMVDEADAIEHREGAVDVIAAESAGTSWRQNPT